MNTTLKITLREVYGRVTAYPACPQSLRMAQLAGTKTLTIGVLRIAADMGFTLQYADRFGACETWPVEAFRLRLAA